MNIDILTLSASKIDYAYVTIANLDKLQVRDLKASLLKWGYGINCEETPVLVVNLIDDGEFFSKLDTLCSYYRAKYSVSVQLNKSGGNCLIDDITRRQERIAIKEAFHLATYEDYQRGARQTIAAIHEQFLKHTLYFMSRTCRDGHNTI